MKRGVRCNSTYLANRKGDYDHLIWRRMARGSLQTLCHKRATYCATDKIQMVGITVI